jgi:Condensation domain/AMP-binding enzyme/TubC N-terminal docking domain
LFQELRSLDVRLTVDGERLRINAPRGALSAALSARIAKHKKTLIKFLRRAKAPLETDSSAIPHVADDVPTPLSFAQERLWFLEQLEPGRPVYNLSRALRIDGPLQVEALEASFNRIVGRHEALRTKFVDGGGRPFQAIAPHRRLRLKAIDLRMLSEAEREVESARLVFEEARRPFDLTSGPLLRIRLLRQREDEYVLFLAVHHIVFDAWSMGILLHELWSLYQGFVDGKTLALPSLLVRYRDYAAWQRAQLHGEVMATDLAFWRKQLAAAPRLELSTDRPRPRLQTFRGARQEVSLTESVTASLNQLSEHEGVTLFMTLLAAFQVLLYRYSGQEDITVGAPVANRDQSGIEGVIGFFVNTLALRVDLSGQPSFKELLRRVREVCLDAYAHQAAPFEKVVEALNLRRELNRNPIFQAMLVLQNTPRRPFVPPGIRLESIEIDNQTAQFDLSLYLRERDGKLIGFFEYSTDLFDPATIARMAGHFQILSASIAADPDLSIATLPMLGAAERQQLLFEWNDTRAEYPHGACIHELFEAQVERTPDAVALEFAEQARSYRELDDDANRLAHELKALGAGPGTIVGVLLERSFEMVASLLAILKTGGAYLPLDPGYPAQRLHFMLADAAAKIVLTQEKFSQMSLFRRRYFLSIKVAAVFRHQRKTLKAKRAPTAELT